jgi:UDP-glucose 4-epimerase
MTQPAIWITGIQGFLGCHLADALGRAGRKIVGFVRADSTQGSQQVGYPLSPEGLAAALDQHRLPARVYHLAGGATVGRSMIDPHGDFLDNVVTTEILLEALRPLTQRVPIVLASSAAVYGGGHEAPINVSDKIVPTSPYGHHKLIAEQLARAHADAFGLPVTICRLFSIYGPGLRKQLLFDACTRLATAPAGAALVLGGTGDEIRDWLHVTDATAGLAALPDPASGQVRCHNLASGQPTTIREIAVTLVRAWGEGGEVSFSGLSRAGDPFSLLAERQSLPVRFAPSVELIKGLTSYVNWFRTTQATKQ